MNPFTYIKLKFQEWFGGDQKPLAAKPGKKAAKKPARKAPAKKPAKSKTATNNKRKVK